MRFVGRIDADLGLLRYQELLFASRMRLDGEGLRDVSLSRGGEFAWALRRGGGPRHRAGRGRGGGARACPRDGKR